MQNPLKRESSAFQVLPDSFFPPEWQDDAKMGNFLAEFRPISLNPENYNAKMRFWKDLISAYCEYKGNCEISIQELKRVFRRKNCSPYCLNKVVEEMFKSGEVVEKSVFLEVPQATWGGWAVDVLVKKPLKWGFTKVVEQVMTVRDDSTPFVCKEVASQQADQLHTLFEQSYDVVLSKEDILTYIGKVGLTAAGAELVFHHLRCQGRLWMEQTEDGKTLCKFAPLHGKVTPITDLERSIFVLEETEKSLTGVIDSLETEINSATTQIKQCLKDGKKQVAKMHLKKRHVLEKNLEKKANVLENVQEMLSKIHDSQKDKDVLGAYKIGTDALKAALAGSGITLDSVDDIIAEMKDAMEVHDEIQSSLGAPVHDVVVDEAELEEELNDLLKEEKPSDGGSGGQVTAPVNFDEEIEKRLRGLRIESHDLPSVPQFVSLK